MAKWIVGVDAGGTNTRAAALDLENGILREGRAVGANWTVHGPELCRAHIEQAMDEALGGETPAAVCITIAGFYPPDHRAEAEAWAARLWPDSLMRVEPDVLAAWAGAHGGEPGIVLISGTGSICFGRDASGRDARAGGWGPLFGDEGSAYKAGVAGLRALAAEVDGIEPTGLLAARVLARWPELGEDLRTWLRGIYRCGWGREQVAEIATEVKAAAAEGDPICERILRMCGDALGRLAVAVQRQLHASPLPVAVQGGFGSNSTVLLDELGHFLGEAGNSLRLKTSELRPLDGAVLLAADSLGGKSLKLRAREVLG